MFGSFGKIFLGNTPSDQRRFITAAFGFLKETHPTLVLPCVGQFALAKCAIEAGYKRENIWTSDISIFSNLLGFYITGQPVEKLGLEVKDDYYHTLTEERDRVAYLMYIIKLGQFDPDLFYQQVYLEELKRTREKAMKQLSERLDSLKGYFGGIHYDPKDVRDEMAQERGADTVMVINPPAYANGYVRMFPVEEVIKQSFKPAEFDWKKEYKPSWEICMKKPFPVLWYRYQSYEGYKNYVVFTREYPHKRYDSWLMTKPELLDGMPGSKAITFKKETEIKSYHNLPIWTDDEELKETDKVQFVKVNDGVAMYYRDLFAHRLGTTSAEVFYLILINNKVFGVVGFMVRHLFSLQADYIFENFGFSAPSKKYPDNNRLLMRFITCQEFRRMIIRQSSRVNRLYNLRAFRTVCLTKYRNVRLNTGLLKIINRKGIKNGMYHIVYETTFRKEGIQEQIKLYLNEINKANYGNKQNED